MAFRATSHISGGSGADLLLRRLSRAVTLTDDEVALVKSLRPAERFPAGTEILPEGEVIRRPRIIGVGWAGRQRVLSDGRRQILGYLLPGDAAGVCSRAQPLAMASTFAITAVETIDAAPLRDVMREEDSRFSGLRSALAICNAAEEGQLIEHVVRLGRLTAYQRTAHVLLELRHRLAAVGLIGAWRFPMPLTQEMLADNLGLSIVHVNRTLQQLRREKLIELKSGWIQLLEPELLASIADFSPLKTSLSIPAA
jgi:CRP-like cAMP-binding protein